jgi:2-keto-4-pentenoate hydratase
VTFLGSVFLVNIDLPGINASVWRDGTRVETGKGTDVLGHPLEAVVWFDRPPSSGPSVMLVEIWALR